MNKAILSPAPRRFIISWRTLSNCSILIRVCTLSTLRSRLLLTMLGKSTMHKFECCMFACFALYMSPINCHLIGIRMRHCVLHSSSHSSFVRFLLTGIPLGDSRKTEGDITTQLEYKFPLPHAKFALQVATPRAVGSCNYNLK